jgi:hypothetical protein
MGGIITTGFNPLGRALPDFSVFGARIPTMVNGTVTVTNSAVYGAVRMLMDRTLSFIC